MFKKPLRVLFPAVFLLPLFFLSGCGPFWVDPYITVRESSLNWVSIHYYSLRQSGQPQGSSSQEGSKPIRRIGVTIFGNGLVEVKKGSSELVSNDFAKRYKSEDWGKIKSYRIQIDPHEANDIFQNLVNYGVLDHEKTGKASKRESFDRFIAVKANLCSNTYSDNVNMFEEDPDLAEQLLDVVREFENPSR